VTLRRLLDGGPDVASLVRQQTHKELRAIVDATTDRNGKRADKLVSDHLLRTLATINIWR
jgi:GntR family transcriptional regulator, transcriptional repressor for pyruvate dehydrogenase complex